MGKRRVVLGTPSRTMTRVVYVKTDMILEVTLRDGSEYEFTDVPVDVAREMRDSHDPDAFFHSAIRRRYPCSKLTSSNDTWHG